MSKKLTIWLVIGIILMVLASVAASAQEMPTPIPPDAGVKGLGAISCLDGKTQGMFDINVVRWDSADALVPIGGWISFTEVGANGVRLNSVVAKQIKSLTVNGNTAEVVATGYWNGRPAEVRIAVLDDNPSGDNLRIVATPIGPTAITTIAPYTRQGGVVKGDISVFSKQQQTAYASGAGTLAVGTNYGKFEFKVRANATLAEGTIIYTESNPRLMRPGIAPLVTILVQKITSLKVDGNVALIEGVGTLNGKPVQVTLKVADNNKPGIMAPTVSRDIFGIQAVFADGSVAYTASGPLVSGDIVVALLPG